MKTLTKSDSASHKNCALMAAALGLAVSATAFSATTELADFPLASSTGAFTIKPNIMFILDDSGSMQWEFLPDYVDSAVTSLRPSYTAQVGDPPYFSPHYNKQYYNPEFHYKTPVAFDGGAVQGALTLVPQNSANTGGWTAVRTDGFNRQNRNQFGTTVTTVNLLTGYPDRVYCTARGDSANDTVACKTNSADFRYAHGYNSLQSTPFVEGVDLSGNVKYRYGPPYYFNILHGEYCSDEEGKDCQNVVPGSGAPPGYPYGFRVRWCSSSTAANATVPAAGTCQGRQVPGFTVPRFAGSTSATVASGRIRIGDSGSTNSVNISEIKVNYVISGVNYSVSIINAPVVAATGTNDATKRAALATAIANAINTFNSTPLDYRACAGTGCSSPPYSGYGLGTVATDTVVIIPVTVSGGTTPVTDTSQAGYVVEVVSPPTNITAASGTVTVSNSGTGTGNITSIAVGPAGGPFVEVLGGGMANFGANSSGNRNAAATAIASRISTFTNGAPWEYTGRVNVACGGRGAATNQVCVDAPLSAGSQPNGYVINVTRVGGVTTSQTNFAGGVSRFIPTTVTNISSGSGFSSPFQRVDIVATRTTYPKGKDRLDCVGAGVCTYDEEMTNFANWYAYYRTRNQAMKSAAGHAFLPMNENYRIGFNTINNTTFNNLPTGGTNWLPAIDNTPANKNIWYNKLYFAGGSSGTPLRNALDRMGQYFAGTLAGTESPIQYSCQQNFSILTSDGYWNQTYDGVGDRDNVNDAAQFCTRENGCYDGGTGATNTLSDVAAYYYRTDLRTDLADKVPITGDDNNPAQHMTTFTLGLGVDGFMKYIKDYDREPGDFAKIKAGASGCPWVGGVCNWPVPAANAQSAVDDLWHAAVSGHGKYFSAQNPAELAEGLSGALQALKVRNGAAAAAATSTPNLTAADNSIFLSTFQTVKWDGEVRKRTLDETNGTLKAVDDIKDWTARTQLNDKVDDDSDTRAIYTTKANAPELRSFTWAELTPTEQNWFGNRCAGAGLLAQCPSLTTELKAVANAGERLVGYLRGQRAMESFRINSGDPLEEVFRKRDFVLGDIAGSQIAYVKGPNRQFVDSGYSGFAVANADRPAMLYVGANDGMLHAFSAETGEEKWAYVPRMIMPDLYFLASTDYGGNHRFYVDGSPTVADIQSGAQWRTILVGGLNKGGRGFYALDVTNPLSPLPLWEICSDSSRCPLRNDPDMGYSFGEPIITKRPSDGKWVVILTSGYNNVSPGDGKGYLYIVDPITGAVLDKIGTGFGDTASPSGLSDVVDYVDNAEVDSTSLLVFGGDLYGNVWRFDLATNMVVKLAELTDESGARQPVTARPDVGECNGNKMAYVGTGRYLGLSDVSNTQLQSVWAIKDSTTPLGEIRSNNMVEQNLSTKAPGVFGVTNRDVDLAIKNGWFVDFDQNPRERVNLPPQLFGSSLLVLTNQPSTGGAAICETGGSSYIYQFSYCKGSPAKDDVVGKKLMDEISVGFNVVNTSTRKAVGLAIGASGGDPEQFAIPRTPSAKPGKRVSWRELLD